VTVHSGMAGVRCSETRQRLKRWLKNCGESTRLRQSKREVSKLAKDPVCNMDVDEKKVAAKSVYKGKTYYFCAKACKEKFDKNPERFVAKEKK